MCPVVRPECVSLPKSVSLPKCLSLSQCVSLVCTVARACLCVRVADSRKCEQLSVALADASADRQRVQELEAGLDDLAAEKVKACNDLKLSKALLEGEKMRHVLALETALAQVRWDGAVRICVLMLDASK